MLSRRGCSRGSVRAQQCQNPSFSSPRVGGEKLARINLEGLVSPPGPDTNLRPRASTIPAPHLYLAR